MNFCHVSHKITKVFFMGAVLTIFSLFISSDSFPSSEAAYRNNTEGIEELKVGNYKKAIDKLKTAHYYLPENEAIRKNLAIAYNNYGFSLMKKDELNLAIQQFENSLYYDSGNAYTFYNTGQAYYRLQNMGKAREYLNRAYGINPKLKGLKELLYKVSNEAKVEEEFEKNETMHFIMASAQNVPVEKTSYVRIYLEEAYGRIGMFLDHYPQNKTVVLLFSGDQYDKLLRNRPYWTMAIFDGKVRIPSEKFKYTNEEIVKIIYHEYTHAVIYDLMKGRCPLWLNEGIASKAETFVEEKNKTLMRKYIEEFGFIPFYNISTNFSKKKDKNTVTLLYIESYLFVEFLVRRIGYSGIKNMLMQIKSGGNYLTAILPMFNEDIEAVEREWEDFVRSEVGINTLRKYGEKKETRNFL